MRKRYAPPTPDAGYYREGDTDYLRELLEVAGISQRKAGPLLGFDERSMRNKVGGKSDLSYPEQYCLEVLADAKLQEKDMGVHDSARAYGAEPRTHWYRAALRPLSKDDAGKMIVGRDKHGMPIQGLLAQDGFGLIIENDAHRVPIARVHLYTLLDPPPAGDIG